MLKDCRMLTAWQERSTVTKHTTDKERKCLERMQELEKRMRERTMVFIGNNLCPRGGEGQGSPSNITCLDSLPLKGTLNHSTARAFAAYRVSAPVTGTGRQCPSLLRRIRSREQAR